MILQQGEIRMRLVILAFFLVKAIFISRCHGPFWVPSVQGCLQHYSIDRVFFWAEISFQ